MLPASFFVQIILYLAVTLELPDTCDVLKTFLITEQSCSKYKLHTDNMNKIAKQPHHHSYVIPYFISISQKHLSSIAANDNIFLYHLFKFLFLHVFK